MRAVYPRTRSLPFLASSLLGAVWLSASCAPPPEPPDEENLAPTAALLWPQRWSTEAAAPFDASASHDADGVLDRVTLSFGDGTPDQDRADGVFEHLYTAPGSYDVRLEVEDEDGARAEVLGTVVVVDRIDDPPCSCDLPCFDDAVCTARGCFLSDASADEATDGGVDARPPVPDPLCP